MAHWWNNIITSLIHQEQVVTAWEQHWLKERMLTISGRLLKLEWTGYDTVFAYKPTVLWRKFESYTFHSCPDKRRNEWWHIKWLQGCLACSCCCRTFSFPSRKPCSKYNGILFLVFVVLFLIFGWIWVPGESLLVERYDHLRTLHVCLFGRHQVCFIRIFPSLENQEKNNYWMIFIDLIQLITVMVMHGKHKPFHQEH